MIIINANNMKHKSTKQQSHGHGMVQEYSDPQRMDKNKFEI